jgi:voltage-gated potassium channel
MAGRLKRKLYDVLVETKGEGLPDRIIAAGLMILIFANVVAVMLETVDEIEVPYRKYFLAFEVVSVSIFSIEYLIRLWIADLNPNFHGSVRGRLRYALTPMALVDLASILPFYLPIALTVDLRILRVLRLFRVFRLFKMARYVESLNTLHRVFRAKKTELAITLLMLMILLVFASSAMYVAENAAQPDKFPNIPATLWWGVVTLTTVGYGDIYPVTPLGKVIGGLIAFMGIGLFALPAGILASGFSEEVHKRREQKKHAALGDKPGIQQR